MIGFSVEERKIYRGHWVSEEILNLDCLIDNIVSMLSFLGMTMVPWFHRRMSLSQEIHVITDKLSHNVCNLLLTDSAKKAKYVVYIIYTERKWLWHSDNWWTSVKGTWVFVLPSIPSTFLWVFYFSKYNIWGKTYHTTVWRQLWNRWNEMLAQLLCHSAQVLAWIEYVAFASSLPREGNFIF